jgi:hypothetical protein
MQACRPRPRATFSSGKGTARAEGMQAIAFAPPDGERGTAATAKGRQQMRGHKTARQPASGNAARRPARVGQRGGLRRRMGMPNPCQRDINRIGHVAAFTVEMTRGDPLRDRRTIVAMPDCKGVPPATVNPEGLPRPASGKGKAVLDQPQSSQPAHSLFTPSRQSRDRPSKQAHAQPWGPRRKPPSLPRC